MAMMLSGVFDAAAHRGGKSGGPAEKADCVRH